MIWGKNKKSLIIGGDILNILVTDDKIKKNPARGDIWNFPAKGKKIQHFFLDGGGFDFFLMQGKNSKFSATRGEIFKLSFCR